MARRPKGRPGKWAELDKMAAGLEPGATLRPTYINGLGVYKGKRSATAWVKVSMPKGSTYRGTEFDKRRNIDIRIGNFDSFSWDQMEAIRLDLQGKADRKEALEEKAVELFGAFAAKWLQRLKVRTKGWETSEVHLNAHLLPRWHKKPLDKFVKADFNNYIAERLEKVKPATVKREIDTVRAILGSAVKLELIPSNPASGVEKISGVVPRQTFLSLEQIPKLLEEAAKEADWLADYVLFSLHSGMRKGETLALKWEDVITHNEILILQIPTSKNDRPRMVDCTSTMADILERQRERSNAAGSASVFPLTKGMIRRRWERARKAAGLSHITIHDLRRTCATLAITAGIPARTVAGRLGHDLSMLEARYAVFSPSAEAASKIEEAFKGC